VSERYLVNLSSCVAAFSCVWLIVVFRELVGLFGLCCFFLVFGVLVGGLWVMGLFFWVFFLIEV
jgi:hypothetical protein